MPWPEDGSEGAKGRIVGSAGSARGVEFGGRYSRLA